jgi:threonine dehydratase
MFWSVAVAAASPPASRWRWKPRPRACGAAGEPEGFDDMARSLRSGRIERNPSLSGSLCDAILTPQPGELTFPILRAAGRTRAGGDRGRGT